MPHALLTLLVCTPLLAAGLQQTDPFVTVAQAAPGLNAYFPAIVHLQDGTLLVAYREGTTHMDRQDGRLVVTDSKDTGRTWTRPRLLVDTDADDRDPKLMQMTDGTVLLNFFSIDYTQTPALVRGTYVMRSQDAGATWSAPILVGSSMANPSGQSVDGYQLGGAATHGAIVELPNGDLLVPLYGTVADTPKDFATVVRSRDGGYTWPAEQETIIAKSDEIHFQEPTLAVLGSGQIIAVLRTYNLIAYVTRSYDNGHSWSEPLNTNIVASSHHVLPLRNKQLLFTYGDMSRHFGVGRPTVGQLIFDPERSFVGSDAVLLYAAGYPATTTDQANPTSVELTDGHFLTVTYDIFQHTIVGVFSDAEDYE